MSENEQSKLPAFTPSFECIAKLKEVSAIDSLIFGAVWRYAQPGDSKRLCNASPVKIADRIGATHNVARRSLKVLCEAGLLEDLTPEANGKTHDYWITDKAHNLLLSNLTRNGQGDNQDYKSTLPEMGKLTLPKTGKHLTRNEQATLPESGNKESLKESPKEKRERGGESSLSGVNSSGKMDSLDALGIYCKTLVIAREKINKAMQDMLTTLQESEDWKPDVLERVLAELDTEGKQDNDAKYIFDPGKIKARYRKEIKRINQKGELIEALKVASFDEIKNYADSTGGITIRTNGHGPMLAFLSGAIELSVSEFLPETQQAIFEVIERQKANG